MATSTTPEYYDATDQMPLLSPSGIAAKPMGLNYQSTAGMPPSLAEAIPPGPILRGDDGDASLGSSSEDDEEAHLTTVKETFLHLLKGYIGPGMLSLPWAVSQLGIPAGFVAVFVMSYWSSYNCWTVVRVKRYIERSRQPLNNNADTTDDNDDKVSETGSSVTTNTNITYPDVGEWAYGKTFQSYVRYVNRSGIATHVHCFSWSVLLWLWSLVLSMLVRRVLTIFVIAFVSLSIYYHHASSFPYNIPVPVFAHSNWQFVPSLLVLLEKI